MDVVISLTSVPKRINVCLEETLKSVLNQSVKLKIILNIPLKYKKWDTEVTIPDAILNNPWVIVNRSNDYGPATKLLGAIEYLKKNRQNVKYIITIDDDILYRDFFHIEKLVNNIEKYPNYAIAIESIKLDHPPYNTRNGLSYRNRGFVDAPCGYSGVLYPIFLFDEYFLSDKFIKTLPGGIYSDDDAYFGIMLNMMNIPLYVPENNVDFGLNLGFFGNVKSAVEENVDIDRITNEMNIYNFAVSNNLLPSHQPLFEK